MSLENGERCCETAGKSVAGDLRLAPLPSPRARPHTGIPIRLLAGLYMRKFLSSASAAYWVCALIFCLSLSSPALTMDFRLAQPDGCKDCAWIEATGPIDGKSALNFDAFVKANNPPAFATVVFDSPGGSLTEGLALGERIRKARYNTTVAKLDPLTHAAGPGAVCASACAYAFLGGVNRSIGTGSRLGYHRFSASEKLKLSTSEAISAAQGVVAGVGQFVADMGVSSDLMLIANATAADSITWLDVDTARKLQVVNRESSAFNQRWMRQKRYDRLFSEFIQDDGSVVKASFFICPRSKYQGEYMVKTAFSLDFGGGRSSEFYDALQSAVSINIVSADGATADAQGFVTTHAGALSHAPTRLSLPLHMNTLAQRERSQDMGGDERRTAFVDPHYVIRHLITLGSAKINFVDRNYNTVATARMGTEGLQQAYEEFQAYCGQ